MKKKNLSWLTAIVSMSLVLLLVRCQDEVKEQPAQQLPEATGLSYTTSTSNNSDTVYNSIVAALNANNAIGIVAEVNHQQNANAAGMEIPPTRVVLFGNPKLGTSLMQANRQAGLDLPQKMLVYQNEAEEVYATFNTTRYLASRHGLDTVSTLSKIDETLTGLAKQATGNDVAQTDDQRVDLNEGIVTQTSAHSFADTYEKLRNALSGNNKIKIIAELDHQQNAQSVGMSLPPTKLIVFGNPELGTPLMKAQQTIGIDLPQKMLVYEDKDGTVKVIHNDPNFLAARHGITDQNELLDQIATALSNLAKQATE